MTRATPPRRLEVELAAASGAAESTDSRYRRCPASWELGASSAVGRVCSLARGRANGIRAPATRRGFAAARDRDPVLRARSARQSRRSAASIPADQATGRSPRRRSCGAGRRWRRSEVQRGRWGVLADPPTRQRRGTALARSMSERRRAARGPQRARDRQSIAAAARRPRSSGRAARREIARKKSAQAHPPMAPAVERALRTSANESDREARRRLAADAGAAPHMRCRRGGSRP